MTEPTTGQPPRDDGGQGGRGSQVSTGSKVAGAIGGLAFLATGWWMYLPLATDGPMSATILLGVAWGLLAAGGVILLRARRPGKLVLLAVASALVWFALSAVGVMLLEW